MRDAQRFVIELEKNLEDRKKQTKGILDVFIQKEWDKQVCQAHVCVPTSLSHSLHSPALP
jgi:hypothetical protein